MPNRDRTGPEGKGPKTGKQMGNCNGAEPAGNRPCCGSRHRRNQCKNTNNK